MRLICPNCDAEYEVDASVIPEAGRDVQCSNCGHAWFQLPPDVTAAAEAEDALFSPMPEEDDEELPPAPAPMPGPAPAIAAEGPAARSIDDSVLSVLREEAERETAARKSEAPQPIETQTELGLQPPPAPDAAARRIAAMKGIETPPPMAEPAKPQARRDLLPEIDEINSTLRATTEPRDGEAGAVAETLGKPGRRGFRTGFLLTVLAAVVATVVYVMAPKLSEQFPGAGPSLTAYVGKVDAGRLWLDETLRSLSGQIRGITSDPG
ncbi:zinc-ribbon domain-containing protein [Tabrizicola sp. KVB23]|uniref:Zinc-ribbon domain-containing protein n=2 Tax=Fuscibacter oryzae TaxID=2803939 RepID=A0A8J7MPZ8_9RHOB|nr:zinc-ribbon domain-containing protein [Fuscibacter oryzae]